jgi:nicotinate phosphoribosyltransferase
MNTSADQAYFDCAYRLQEHAGQACRKRSEGKATWPGRKQVWRQFDPADRIAGDTPTTLDDEGSGTALFEPDMCDGRRLEPSPPLVDIRERVVSELDTLPDTLRRLEPASATVPVRVSPALTALAEAVDRRPH